MTETLLITACINPTTNIALQVSQPLVRLESYKKSLHFWIDHSDFKNIIFCENSNFDYDFNEFITKAKTASKNLEVIRFIASEGGQVYGKGFSEGEIIEYALLNSSLLSDASSFYKVTGMRIVHNINALLKQHSLGPTFFNKAAPFADMADTRFFKVSREFFSKELQTVYKHVRDKELIYMEHLYLKILKASSVPSFKIYPDIRGISGSMGTVESKTKLGFFLRNIATKFGFYTV
tara:strand:- start:75942 stop:76646 length:705 start_codon:yes stop_codon:yes gene_type:complete